jgi:dienelactone hydrolase
MGRTLKLFAALCLFFLPAYAQNSANLDLRGHVQKLRIYGVPGNPPIILSSGDLGWSGLVVHVAEFLEKKGYFVIGLDSKDYLSGFTDRKSTLSPDSVPGDYLALIEHAKRSGPGSPVLAGISEGAGLSVLAATDPKVKQTVRGILALGLPDWSELAWRWEDFTIWITKKNPKEPGFQVSDIIGRVSPVPLAEIHSTHDEFLPLEKAKSMIASAGEPKRMWVIEAENHRFSNAREDLDRTILEALAWIVQPR